METTWLLCLPILILLIILVFFVFLYSILMYAFTRSSHLDKLSERYATTIEPQRPVLTREKIRIGPVRYRNCVTVSFDLAGLYLWVKPAFVRHQPLLIPWSDIRGARATRLYWGQAMELSIGEPQIATVTFPNERYDQMRPYLRWVRSS